ncbi:LuxR C-terminal-related transcriptional regulator [Kordiimonas lipolytica]|uniref:LuxR C-terminal-related transcriptional regulator n=1 Tax=Kordiimonas lipolytica TaxID=1662421 RepID=A0ABV8UGM0_9PROT|nr:LuxR C-terminal-related transcriptional regulator [Kordiimonas lipolytica]
MTAEKANFLTGHEASHKLHAAKLSPPNHAINLVSRQWMDSFIFENQSKKAVILRAPAGFGKTSVASQFYHALSENGLNCVWLSLDDNDNVTETLLSYLFRALSQECVGLSDVSKASIAAFSGASEADLVFLLQEVLEDIDGLLYLFLDNAEVLEKDAMEKCIQPILQVRNSGVRLVICSRSKPSLKVSKIRVKGLLQEVGPDELSFSKDEIKAVFSGAICDQEATQIFRRTEGWPVAVQVLKQWYVHNASTSSILEQFNGALEEIAEFLAEQILLGLDENLRSLLMRTSIFDELTEDKVNFAMGELGYWRQLQSIQGLDAFVTKDAKGKVVRFHPLLKDYLRFEFERKNPDEWTELQESAARWCFARENIVSAIKHARQSKKQLLVGELVEDAGGRELLLRVGWARLKEVDRQLTDSILRLFPRLQLMRSIILMKEGKLTSARQQFEKTRQLTNSFQQDRDGGNIEKLRLDASYVDMSLMVNECRVCLPEEFDRNIATISRLADEDHTLQGNINTLLCINNHQRGLLGTAAEYLQRAQFHYRNAGSTHGEIFCNIHQGTMKFLQGSPEYSRNSYKAALSLARRSFGTDRSKLQLIDPLVAEIDYETNNIADAAHRTNKILQCVNKTEGWLDIVLAGFMTASLVSYLQSGAESALDMVDACVCEADRQGRGQLRNSLASLRSSILARAGLITSARDVLISEAITFEAVVAKFGQASWREVEANMIAILDVESRDSSGMVGFVEANGMVLKFFEQGLIRPFIRVGILTCKVGFDQGHIEESYELFDRVTEKIVSTGYVRHLIDEYSVLSEFIAARIADDNSKVSPDILRQVEYIIELCSEPAHPAVSEILTKREREVLRSLSEGNSDKLIARELGVSNNTVKFHVKNLYRKLGANNREHASEIARDLDVL